MGLSSFTFEISFSTPTTHLHPGPHPHPRPHPRSPTLTLCACLGVGLCKPEPHVLHVVQYERAPDERVPQDDPGLRTCTSHNPEVIPRLDIVAVVLGDDRTTTTTAATTATTAATTTTSSSTPAGGVIAPLLSRPRPRPPFSQRQHVLQRRKFHQDIIATVHPGEGEREDGPLAREGGRGCTHELAAKGALHRRVRLVLTPRPRPRRCRTPLPPPLPLLLFLALLPPPPSASTSAAGAAVAQAQARLVKDYGSRVKGLRV
jgi:hypothetical protein